MQNEKQNKTNMGPQDKANGQNPQNKNGEQQPEPSGVEAHASLPDGFLPEKRGEKGIKAAQKSQIDCSTKK